MILRSLLILALMFSVMGYGVGSPKAEKPEKAEEAEKAEEVEDKVLKSSHVSKKMAEVWCEKLEECTSGEEMSARKCRKILKKSFQEGFKNTIEGQKVEVTQSTLSQCSASIKKDSCEALQKAQTLAGCEFIALLNQPS